MPATEEALTPALASAIAGVDLAAPLDDASIDFIRARFVARSVLVFRDQRLTPEAQLAFSTRFGEPERHVLKSFALLAFLCAHVTRPEFVYRHHWNAGDLVMWDNRATLHCAVADYDMDQPRHMHRTSIAGDRPRGPGATVAA